MTRQTSHAHATRCARSDFNRFFLCTTFAVQLQTYSKISFRLQFNCKYVPKLHVACGNSANILQNCMVLAELPQILCKIAYFLRNFRKYISKLYDACGSSASIIQKCASFAELPQMMRKMKRCSSQSAQIPHAIVLHHRHNNLL